MMLPAPVKRGPGWLRKAFEVRDAFMRSTRPLRSETCEVHETADGTQILPGAQTGGRGAAIETWPFQGYRSAYTGTGTAPADQERRVRVRESFVKSVGHMWIPSNMSQEFVCAASGRTYFWVDGTMDASGTATAMQIDKGSDLPTDPAGALNSAPTHSYWGLFYVDCNATKILEITRLAEGPLQVIPVPLSIECDGQTVAYQWT